MSGTQQQQQSAGQPAPAPASLGRTLKAVAWSFVGMRRASGMAQDVQLNPLHIVFVGIGCTILLVLGLVGLVHWVV